MSTQIRSNWHALLAAGILALGAAMLTTGAEAGGGAVNFPHACFANDSIAMGKRLAPRPDVIQARLNSLVCREQSALSARSPEDEAAIQRELDRIDRRLANLLRGAANPSTPSSAN